jgi:hypothetical protein
MLKVFADIDLICVLEHISILGLDGWFNTFSKYLYSRVGAIRGHRWLSGRLFAYHMALQANADFFQPSPTHGNNFVLGFLRQISFF